MKYSFDKFLHLPIVNQLYHFYKNLQKPKLIYNPLDLNKTYYNKIKNLNDKELEHQIGRLTNYKDIIKKCSNLRGDFIEYGTWQGFSLLWIAYFIERNAMFDKKIIGLDGFIGLPFSDGIFKKGQFSDTSYKLCKRNIYKNDILYYQTKNNIHIGKFLFSQKKGITEYIKSKKITKFCFIHIDCDIYQPIKDIFDVLIKQNLIADKAYILFDDYGCESNLKFTIDKLFTTLKNTWIIKVHSSTRYTKNFIFIKK